MRTSPVAIQVSTIDLSALDIVHFVMADQELFTMLDVLPARWGLLYHPEKRITIVVSYR